MTDQTEINNNHQDSDYLSSRSRIRIGDLLEAKCRGEKWVMLTSYDATSARIFDKAKIPCLLVGDSAAQAIYGYKTTLPISVSELIPLARAVVSSSERALVVGDLPFGSYQESPQQALQTATRFMKEAQVHAIKLEGGQEYREHVSLLTRSGIPVMAHIGFTPQSEHMLGGYKVQGRASSGSSHSTRSESKLLEDALVLESAGAFACVLELAPSSVASNIRAKLSIPLVGIGAGPHCDAQVLVWNDMAGFTTPKGSASGYLRDGSSAREEISDEKFKPTLELNRVPKFVKQYGNVSEVIYNSAISFAIEVRSGKYPDEEHSYK